MNMLQKIKDQNQLLSNFSLLLLNVWILLFHYGYIIRTKQKMFNVDPVNVTLSKVYYDLKNIFFQAHV